MHQVDQILPTASSLCQAGVSCENFDREVNLIDNSLPRSVAAVEEFKVFNSIVGANSVNVVDSLSGEKFAPQMFGHDVSVLHNMFLGAGSSEHRDVYPNVSVALGVFFVPASFEFMLRLFLLGFYLAFVTAVLLFSVDTTAALLFACAMFFLPAILTDKFISLVRILATSEIRALHRAIQRVSSEFLLVRGKVGLHHRERLTAFTARKINGSAARSGKLFRETVLTTTLQATVFTSFFRFARVAVKRLLAIRTWHLNGHGFFSGVWQHQFYTNAHRACQVT